MTKTGHVFSKLRHFFPISEKGQGRPPPSPRLVMRLKYKNTVLKNKSYENYISLLYISLLLEMNSSDTNIKSYKIEFGMKSVFRMDLRLNLTLGMIL